jgi:hypothetical protein
MTAFFGNPTSNDSLLQPQSLKSENSQGMASDRLNGSACTCLLCSGAQVPGEKNGLTVAAFELGGTDVPDSKWPQEGGNGEPLELTYSYNNLLDGGMEGISPTTIRAAVEEALGVWAEYAPLEFVEVEDDPSGAILRFDHDRLVIYQAGQTYLPNSDISDPLEGDVTFNESIDWTAGEFLETAVHEIGHALGLGHELTEDAIMNYRLDNRFSGLGQGFILPDDIQGIQALYGAGEGSVTPLA